MCQWSLFQSDIQSMTFPPEFNCSPWYMSDIVRYLVILPLIHTTVHLVYINTLVTHCDQQQLSNVSMFAGGTIVIQSNVLHASIDTSNGSNIRQQPAFHSNMCQNQSKQDVLQSLVSLRPTEHLQILFQCVQMFYLWPRAS